MIFHPEGGSDTAATVVTNLLTPNPDFLRRCWFYCDQILATLMAEALMFSLHRRDGTDTVFVSQREIGISLALPRAIKELAVALDVDRFPSGSASRLRQP